MSSHIPRPLAREVRERAGDFCEYCLLRQDSQEATFHVDHIVLRSRSGPTTLDNLALACVSCSLRKAARHTARDPRTGKLVPLYNLALTTGTTISHSPSAGVLADVRRLVEQRLNRST